MIWGAAPHNAFTDLIRHDGWWYCVFREGAGHVSPDGALRVIRSRDGAEWESAARIESTTGDLRDAKITVTPDGRLMLSGAEALHDRSQYSHQSLAWFSSNGTDWGDAVKIGDPNFWLWRTTWHAGQAYAMGYQCGPEKSLRLYRSDDGEQFEVWVPTLLDEGYPNETSVVFRGEEAICLLRRDGSPSSGLLGVSQPPYRQWEWRDLGTRIGGPQMIQLADGRFIAAVRLYDGAVRTSLCWVDVDAGKIEECVKLPSGGDTSYAGLVEHDGMLWVSYYSSHEGKTQIYLAQVELDPGDELEPGDE